MGGTATRTSPRPRAALTLVSRALPGEREVDHDLVDGAVKAINGAINRRSLDLAREVGRCVVDTFFGGNVHHLRERGRRHRSFAALAEREDLQYHRIWLWRVVSVYEQLSVLPVDVADALPFTHHTLLLPVLRTDTKVDLARRAVRDRWSKRELQAEIDRLGGRDRRAVGGRRAALPVVRTVRRLDRALREEDALAGVDDLPRLAPAERATLVRTVRRAREALEQLERALLVER